MADCNIDLSALLSGNKHFTVQRLALKTEKDNNNRNYGNLYSPSLNFFKKSNLSRICFMIPNKRCHLGTRNDNL